MSARKHAAAPARPAAPKAAPPAPAAAPPAPAAARPATLAPPGARVGVYMDANRHTAIVVRSRDFTVWYLTMKSGSIEVRCRSLGEFLRRFTISLPAYPVLRAVRKFHSSTITRDEQAEKVMNHILQRNDLAE